MNFSSVVPTAAERDAICNLVDEECPLNLSSRPAVVVTAYILVFVPWGFIALSDMITQYWKTIRDAYVHALIQLAIALPTIAYTMYYIHVQRVDRDYKEMCAAFVALSLSVFHFSRTVWGLWQLYYIRKWATSCLWDLHRHGYSIPQIREDNYKLRQYLLRHSLFRRRLRSFRDGLRSWFRSKRESGCEPSCQFRALRSTLEALERIFLPLNRKLNHWRTQALKLIARNPPKENEKVRTEKVLNELAAGMLINSSMIDNEFYDVDVSFGFNWWMLFHPKERAHANETWISPRHFSDSCLRFMVPFLAQFGRRWVQESHKVRQILSKKQKCKGILMSNFVDHAAMLTTGTFGNFGTFASPELCKSETERHRANWSKAWTTILMVREGGEKFPKEMRTGMPFVPKKGRLEPLENAFTRYDSKIKRLIDGLSPLLFEMDYEDVEIIESICGFDLENFMMFRHIHKVTALESSDAGQKKNTCGKFNERTRTGLKREAACTDTVQTFSEETSNGCGTDRDSKNKSGAIIDERSEGLYTEREPLEPKCETPDGRAYAAKRMEEAAGADPIEASCRSQSSRETESTVETTKQGLDDASKSAESETAPKDASEGGGERQMWSWSTTSCDPSTYLLRILWNDKLGCRPISLRMCRERVLLLNSTPRNREWEDKRGVEFIIHLDNLFAIGLGHGDIYRDEIGDGFDVDHSLGSKVIQFPESHCRGEEGANGRRRLCPFQSFYWRTWNKPESTPSILGDTDVQEYSMKCKGIRFTGYIMEMVRNYLAKWTEKFRAGDVDTSAWNPVVPMDSVYFRVRKLSGFLPVSKNELEEQREEGRYFTQRYGHGREHTLFRSTTVARVISECQRHLLKEIQNDRSLRGPRDLRMMLLCMLGFPCLTLRIGPKPERWNPIEQIKVMPLCLKPSLAVVIELERLSSMISIKIDGGESVFKMGRNPVHKSLRETKVDLRDMKSSSSELCFQWEYWMHAFEACMTVLSDRYKEEDCIPRSSSSNDDDENGREGESKYDTSIDRGGEHTRRNGKSKKSESVYINESEGSSLPIPSSTISYEREQRSQDETDNVDENCSCCCRLDVKAQRHVDKDAKKYYLDWKGWKPQPVFERYRILHQIDSGGGESRSFTREDAREKKSPSEHNREGVRNTSTTMGSANVVERRCEGNPLPEGMV